MLQRSAAPRAVLRTRVIDFLPAAVTVAVVLTGLLVTETPPMAIVRYAAYLVLAVLLPGTLVHRALRGRDPLLIADLALGGATGLLLGLLAWAVFMLLGVQEYLWSWPLAVFVPFAAVPSLRRHWRLGGHTERSRATSWLLAGALCVYTLGLLVVTIRSMDMLPKPNLYYIDVYWHLGNAAELTRSLPPEVPSVAGRTLRYHWFFNAHVAESHLISGVDLPTIMIRLWEIPVVAVILGLVVAVSRKATGAIWPGAVAALLIAVPAQLMPWSWYKPWSSNALTEGSPSQVFGLLPLLLAAHVLVDLVRDKRIGRGWLILGLAVLAAPGCKPSVMPVLLAGVGCCLLLNLLRRRPVRRLLAALAMMVAAVLAMAPLVAQSAAASGIKLFGLLYFVRTWAAHSPRDELPTTGGYLIGGFDLFALLLVATILMQFVWVLAALPLVKHRDPAVVFLAGGFVASLVATLVVDHAGASEIYFGRTGVPFGAILAAWGLYVVLPKARRRVLGIAVVATGVGGVIVLAVVLAGRGPEPTVEDAPRAIAVPLGVLVLAVVLAFTAWWMFRRTAKGYGVAVFCAAVLVVFSLQGPAWTADAAWTAATEDRRPFPAQGVTARETLAARWMAENVPRDDIIATNVHCLAKVTKPRCDGRAYWVSAFTERRILVESWAYTEETLRQLGQHPGGFLIYPFDEPEKFAANEQAFKDPTPEGLARLRDEYRVSWLFADRLAGPVSPRLRELADLRISNEDVDVYELRR